VDRQGSFAEPPAAVLCQPVHGPDPRGNRRARRRLPTRVRRAGPHRQCGEGPRVTLMTEVDAQRRKGITLVVAAAVAWSTAAYFTRLLPFDSWTILFWRGLFGAAMIAAILVLLQGWNGLRDFIRMDRYGWLVASLSALAMVCFI